MKYSLSSLINLKTVYEENLTLYFTILRGL